MGRSLVVVEGHGEVDAALNLLTRLSAEVGHPTVWSLGGRCNALKKRDRTLGLCEQIRARGL